MVTFIKNYLKLRKDFVSKAVKIGVSPFDKTSFFIGYAVVFGIVLISIIYAIGFFFWTNYSVIAGLVSVIILINIIFVFQGRVCLFIYNVFRWIWEKIIYFFMYLLVVILAPFYIGKWINRNCEKDK